MRRCALLCVIEHSFLDDGDAHLLQQCEIVLDVPIVGDAAVLDFHKIGMKGTGRPLPCVCPKLPVKWPVKLMCTVT